jgi:hypothetical protein
LGQGGDAFDFGALGGGTLQNQVHAYCEVIEK